MPHQKLVYPELSYQVVGQLYKIYNELGFGYQEKYYQRAFAAALEASGIRYRREEEYPIGYRTKIIGKYYIDFIIDEKVAIELKVSKGIYRRHLTQMLGYLKHADLRLGILVAFTPEKVIIKRVVH